MLFVFSKEGKIEEKDVGNELISVCGIPLHKVCKMCFFKYGKVSRKECDSIVKEHVAYE